MPSPVIADVGRAEVGECADGFQKLGRNALFCIPELGILATFQFNPCVFSIRDVLHHPCSCRFRNPLLPGSVGRAPAIYRTTICLPLGVFIHKLVALGRLI